MSFEEWWKTKDYPARCKGNCKEAYEAGMKADVHTDNSQVIAELEAQIEKMKCCGNCDWSNYLPNGNCLDCDGKKNWKLKEIKEND